MLRTLWSRFRSLWQRREVKREIDEELHFHLEQRAAENIEAGMSAEEAAREAQKRFGNLQSVREECRKSKGASFGETTWKDIRFGARMLRRNRASTFIVVLTLGLGIGATTSIFSVVNGVLLKPLRYQDPSQLVLVWEHPGYGVGPGVFLDWKENSKSFAGLSVVNNTAMNLKGDGKPERLKGWSVSANFLGVLCVQPLLGRGFLPNEDQPGQDNQVVILSNALWKRQFGSDPNVIGHTVHLNTEIYTAPLLRTTTAGPEVANINHFWKRWRTVSPCCMAGLLLPRPEGNPR